jgi:hypothetical protein
MTRGNNWENFLRSQFPIPRHRARDRRQKAAWKTNAVTVRVMGKDNKVKALDPAEFASKQLELLEKERLAEVAEVSDAITLYSPSQLQTRGLALLNLVINSVRTGLGGKTFYPNPSNFNASD